jgi:hypothetical protein
MHSSLGAVLHATLVVVSEKQCGMMLRSRWLVSQNAYALRRIPV